MHLPLKMADGQKLDYVILPRRHMHKLYSGKLYKVEWQHNVCN